MLKKLLNAIVLSFVLVQQLYAADIEITGTVNPQNPFINTNNSLKSQSNIRYNDITLMKLGLSGKAINTIEKRASKIQQSYAKSELRSMPTQVELGMNNVPVLNQGAHGSCVIFSVTAAIDAVLNKGDYVSQICQLSLGRFIENNGHISSGWNGAFIRNILSEMELFGFISKDVQRTNGCAGLVDYPESGEDLLNEQSVMDFHKFSEKLLTNKIAWSSILDIFQASIDSINEDTILLDVKKTLLSGDRIVLGVILLDYDKGVVGAQGTFKTKNDTWVLTPEMISNINNQQDYAGHALVITGYNDKATAIDSEGRVHQGLLTLRNSWGNDIGDRGDFYMSYDYFKTLVIEAQRIRHL